MSVLVNKLVLECMKATLLCLVLSALSSLRPINFLRLKDFNSSSTPLLNNTRNSIQSSQRVYLISSQHKKNLFLSLWLWCIESTFILERMYSIVSFHAHLESWSYEILHLFSYRLWLRISVLSLFLWRERETLLKSTTLHAKHPGSV